MKNNSGQKLLSTNLVKPDDERLVWYMNCLNTWIDWRDNCLTSKECRQTDGFLALYIYDDDDDIEFLILSYMALNVHHFVASK